MSKTKLQAQALADQRAALFARISKKAQADSNITRASRTANAQWNVPANRRARRNAARLMAAGQPQVTEGGRDV